MNNITKSGPLGYKYQHKATLLLTLSLLKNIKNIQLFNEPQGKEDALIRYKENKITKTIHVQAKSEKNNLNINKLVSWLCHFHNNNTNLLQTIIDDSNTSILFITNSEHIDTNKLTHRPQNINQHRNVSIKKEWRELFNKRLNNLPSKLNGQTINHERKTFCIKQTELFKQNKNLSTFLKRIIIWGNLSANDLDYQNMILLNQSFHIPSSKENSTYYDLIKTMENNNGNNVNIIPKILQIIKQNNSKTPKIEDYKKRNNEEKLIEKLESEGVLLLTGLSLCGKSLTAKYIANFFRSNGYNYDLFNNVRDVETFFLKNNEEAKVVILDDPWGHLTIVNNSDVISSDITRIINNKESQHKLIITSRTEIIVELNVNTDIKKINILGHKWTDLTIKESSIINNIWKDIATNKIDKKVIKTVIEGNKGTDSNNLLQIGQLSYLLNSDKDKTLTELSFSELSQIARSDSKDITRTISEAKLYHATVLSIICLGATTTEPISFKELAYILSNSNKYYSCNNPDNQGHSFNETDNSYPKYETDYTISEDIKESLIYLEKRQFITTEGEDIFINHSNYYEAGRLLFFSKTSQIEQTEFLKKFKLSISCINPITTNNASLNFYYIHDNINKSLRNNLIEIAYFALNSIYPSVRENSLVFLSNILNYLNNEIKEDVISYIKKGISNANIYWHNDIIPYYSNTNISLNNDFILSNDYDISKITVKLETNKNVNSKEIFFYVVKNIQKKDTHISKNILKSIVLCKNAFIRKKIPFLAFSIININNNEDIINRLFKDEHPDVVFNSIRATITNWFNYSDKQKIILKEYIKNALKNTIVAIRTYNLTATFFIDYSHEGFEFLRETTTGQKEELAILWVEMFELVFNNNKIPHLFINTSRFTTTLREGFSYLNINNSMRIINSWHNRINYLFEDNELFDVHFLSVTDYLFEVTNQNYTLREDLFNKLINHSNTNFSITNIDSCLRNWNLLHKTEIQQLIILINSNIDDIRWIKAFVLISKYNKPELINDILDYNYSTEISADKFIRKTHKELLHDSLKLYCEIENTIQIFNFQKNEELWDNIVKNILLNKTNDPIFNICIDFFIYNGLSGFKNYWNDGLSIWEQVCKKHTNINYLCERLIIVSSKTNYDLKTNKELFNILLNSTIDEIELELLLNTVANNIEILQFRYNENEIFEIFDNSHILKIIKLIEPDNTIWDLINTIKKRNTIINTHIFDKITKITNNKSIRLFKTLDIIISKAKQNIIPISLNENIETIKNNIYSVSNLKTKQLNAKHYETLNKLI